LEGRIPGAIYMQNDSTEAHFSNCKFETNVAVGPGGAIRAIGIPDVTVDACEFKLNSAEEGGAINIGNFGELSKPAEFLLTNSEFIENGCNFWGRDSRQYGQ